VRLSDTSIRRPVFAVMLIGGLVALGLVSIPRLGIDLWPRVEFPLVTVQTVLPGAAPETMEREVTEVLEESINTIEGVRSLRSNSSDSLSLLFVEFELEYEIQEKAQQVREKVSAVRGELPADVEPPVGDPAGRPLLDPQRQRAGGQADQDPARAHPGRGQREPGGRPPPGDPDLDRSDPAERPRAGRGRRAVELPAGRIETAQREYALKTEGKLTSAEEFAGLVVTTRGGRVIHLRDIATVEDGLAEERTVSRLDGRRGVALMVRRQSGENTVRVVDAVKAEIERIRPDLPEGYEMVSSGARFATWRRPWPGERCWPPWWCWPSSATSAPR
jgi:HAE1 family hydrophobic/amphiphilic exporter-1